MKRTPVCAFVWLVVLCGIAHAAPIRQPLMPEPSRPPVNLLAGTTWIGTLYDPNSKITFHANGTLTYGEPDAGTPGLWKLNGDQLYFEINQYSHYQTTLKGDVIQGTGTNKSGMRCNPILRRIGPESGGVRQ